MLTLDDRHWLWTVTQREDRRAWMWPAMKSKETHRQTTDTHTQPDTQTRGRHKNPEAQMFKDVWVTHNLKVTRYMTPDSHRWLMCVCHYWFVCVFLCFGLRAVGLGRLSQVFPLTVAPGLDYECVGVRHRLTNLWFEVVKWKPVADNEIIKLNLRLESK